MHIALILAYDVSHLTQDAIRLVGEIGVPTEGTASAAVFLKD